MEVRRRNQCQLIKLVPAYRQDLARSARPRLRKGVGGREVSTPQDRR
jgi:hypothetical protein